MIRIHKDNVVPKYSIGKWSWELPADELNFTSWEDKVNDQELVIELSSGFKFKAFLNQIEEIIFRQEFARSSDLSEDSEIIKIEDIKNLVLFLAPSEILTKKFIKFIHTRTIDRFLNALIIYFEYFLRLAEFILIRRDEVSGETAQVQSEESTKIKRIFSEHLSQYRLILAREYSEIVMGMNDDMEPFYHLNTLVCISKTYPDRRLHEIFLAFATQVVWIAHHRKALRTIDDEMNRLFRSEHFKLSRKDSIEFSPTEQELLYGRNNKRANYRRQNSPLIQEISIVRKCDMPILWLGLRKYRGNDLRMRQLELEIIIPDSDLCLIDTKHGILGNPKWLYNTMLSVDDEKLRERGHHEDFDPFFLIRQPYLEIPNLEAVKNTSCEQLESYFEIKDERFKYDKKAINKWKRRDKIIEYIQSGGLVIDVIERCKKELATRKVQQFNIASITKAFIMRKRLLRKN